MVKLYGKRFQTRRNFISITVRTAVRTPVEDDVNHTMDVSITYLPSAPHPVWWPVIANFILWARSSRSYYWSQAPPQNTQPSARPRFAFSSALQKQVMGNTEGYKQRKSEQKVHNYSVCIQFADNEAPLKRRYTYTDHTAQQPRNKLLHTRSRQNLKPHTVC